MKKNRESDLLISSDTAIKLYTEYAANMPIFDYHSHVSAKEIYENRRYSSITQLWLECDHYKWRLMRLCGVDEYYITGEASDKEKFLKFAEILPLCVGNPVYSWCHMELEKYFGYKGVLNADTANEVWECCESKLNGEGLCVRELIRQSNVRFIGTTDDPCDSLEWHRLLCNEELGFKVSPTFRPDAYLNIDKPDFCDKIERLASASGVAIDGINTLKSAFRKRMNYFAACGCVSADHGCDYISYHDFSGEDMNRVLQKALSGASLCDNEIDLFKSGMMTFCAEQYAELDWVMQIHYNCIRNPNTRAFGSLGADRGFDCISRHESSKDLSLLLDRMKQCKMPKIILYSLDANENFYLDTLVGSFACGQPCGRIMHGAAWWFNDTRVGISAHLESMSSLGVLGNFIGMLTDSRSFLSYVRHDYFRRILCSHIASVYESGEYREDIERAGEIIQNICYNNSRKFFGMEDTV